MTDVLEYSDAVKEERGDLIPGRLKLTSTQIIFKNHKTGRVDNLSFGDIQKLSWQRLALSYCLRIMMNNGQLFRYGGLKESEQEKLEKFVKQNYAIVLDTQDLSLRGWNWGTAAFENSVLNFSLSKKADGADKAFEIPLSNVSHCTTAKNEVTVEFHPNDDAPVSLMEMRFHIPSLDGVDPVQLFLDQVLSNASIIRETGECIAIFKELQCLTPRGRYDIKIFPTFIQLHGKTFDYKIPITSVLRMFQLPHKDSRQMFFVVSLDPPIKQGQTRYHFLILLFNKDENISIDLGLKDHEIKEKYAGKLNRNMSGPLYEVIARVFSALIPRKIKHPDPGAAAITCSYRASNGLLYLLERGFIYIHKPPIHIRFDELLTVNFARSGGSTRSFDFEIEKKMNIIHTFSSIDKEEYSKLFDFVQKKGLKLKNRGPEKFDGSKVEVGDMDSDMEDEPDAYLQRVREEGRIREEVDDDFEDESDDDFAPGQDNDEDVAEEFDSDFSDNSDSEQSGSGSERKKEKKHKHKEAKHKREKKQREGESKKKSKKSKNDDGRPKRPQSAFFLWMNENREQIKKKNPELSLTEVAKKAGDLWKELAKDEKTKYEEKAAKAKKQFDIDMAEFKAKGGGGGNNKSDDDGGDSKKHKKSDPSKKSKKSPVKSGGSSQQFKSKEYISSDSSNSDSDESDSKKNDKNKKKATKSTKAGSQAKSKSKKSKSDDDDEKMASSDPSNDDNSEDDDDSGDSDD